MSNSLKNFEKVPSSSKNKTLSDLTLFDCDGDRLFNETKKDIEEAIEKIDKTVWVSLKSSIKPHP
jgi:hypothetical protein